MSVRCPPFRVSHAFQGLRRTLSTLPSKPPGEVYMLLPTPPASGLLKRGHRTVWCPPFRVFRQPKIG